jgi:hypothetical protein
LPPDIAFATVASVPWKPNSAEDAIPFAQRGGAVEAERAPEEDEVLARGEVVAEGGVLRAVADPPAALERARVRGEQAGADAQQRGLAGAVLAHERDHLARAEDELGTVEHRPLAEALDDAGADQRGVGAH